MSLRAHDWGLTAQAVPGRVVPYPRGRVSGGSSAVNATIALRGVPADYDQWAALGNGEWGWAKVLPYFRRLEDDPLGDGGLHGRGGPIAIARWRPGELVPVQRAFFDVCVLGFPEVADHNHPQAAGVGSFPQNRRGPSACPRRSATCCPPGTGPTSPSHRACLVSQVLV
jgi:choline dehydrogenase